VFEQKINGNRPFADLEKVMFGVSDFLLVRLLQGGKTPNVKRLQDIRGVWRHTRIDHFTYKKKVLASSAVLCIIVYWDNNST
jgi:hypothetical protein